MRRKPSRHAFDRARVRPEWRWFWESAVSAVIGWEHAGAVFDYESRALLNGFSSPLMRATPSGLAMNLVSASDAFQTTAPNSVRVGYPLTMFFGFTPTGASASAHSTMYGVTHNNAASSPFASYTFAMSSDGNNMRVSCNTAGTLRTIFNASGPPLTSGAIMHLATTLKDGAQQIFKDGAFVASDTQALAAAPTYAATALLTFGDGAFAVRVGSGDYHYGYTLAGALTNSQIAMIARDPYGMFRQDLLSVGRVPDAVAALIGHGMLLSNTRNRLVI